MLLLSLSGIAAAQGLPDWNPVDPAVADEDWPEAPSEEELIEIWDDWQSRVTGGTDVASGDWESTAAIIYSGLTVGCTGVLVAPDIVMTAAHCDSGILGVLVGANSLSNGSGQLIPARATRKYASLYWNSYDIAIIKLRWASVYDPVDLALDCAETTYVQDGQDAVIVGYGATDPFGFVYVNELQEADITIADHDCSVSGEGCVSAIEPTGELIAGSSTGQDSCYGDSGGPMYLDTPDGVFLAGIVSRGTSSSGGICGSVDSTIYVRPNDDIANWIEGLAGITLPRPNCGPPPPQAPEAAPLAAASPEVGEAEAVGCSVVGTAPLGLGWLALMALGVVRRRN